MIVGLKHTTFVAVVSTICAVLFTWGKFSISVGKCDTNETETFPMPHYDDLLTVPVNIANKEYLFVLDTGATFSVLDSQLVSALGKPIKQVTTGQDAHGRQFESAIYHPPRAILGALEIEQNASVLCLDLSLIRSAMGRDIKGILGMPFFKSSIVQFDFDHRQIRIFPISTKPKDAWGEKINVIETDSGLPEIAATFCNNLIEPCVVDTGCSMTASLRPGLFGHFMRTGSITPIRRTRTVSFGGVSNTAVALLSTISVAANSSNSLKVHKSKTNYSTIGLDYFRRYLVTFDLGKHRIFLSKGERFDEPEDEVYIGVGVLRLKGKTIIRSVASNSLADKAGFQVDDELLAVAGEPIDNKPLAEIRWSIKSKVGAEEDLTVDIRRESEVLSLRLAASNRPNETSKRGCNSTGQVLHQ